MTTIERPAEAFPPGEFLRDELEARDWTQADFALILGRSPRDVSEIINAKRQITARTAKELAEALGTSAEFWMRLQVQHDLYKTELEQEPGNVARRARLFQKAPVSKMISRGWIKDSASVEVLERQLLDFLSIESLDEDPRVWPHAARKSGSYHEITGIQWAWLCRSRQLAHSVLAERFTDTRFRKALARLRECLHAKEEIRKVPGILAEGGVRLVLVESLPSAKLDGATFWLDKHSPVVALSLRYDRIDWWWFTLLHELGHVKNRDGLSGEELPLDFDLSSRKRSEPPFERAADEFAESYLVEPKEIQGFVARVRPLYSKERIRLFAERIGVHPGIVVGQLQKREEISYAHSRQFLVKVQDIVSETALTDGWGHMPSISI